MNTETDQEVVVDVDLDTNPKCNITQAECGEDAVSRAVLVCCGLTWAACAEHKQGFNDWLTKSILVGLLIGDPVHCGECDARMELPRWVAL